MMEKTMNNALNCTKYIVVSVSTLCNLKCKNCITFIPYHKHPRNFKVDEILSDLRKFFDIFYDVTLERIDFGGGEPFLHPDIAEIADGVISMFGAKFKQLRILTNGSVPIPSKLIDVAAKCELFLLIDNYGPVLSPCADGNKQFCEKNNILYRVNTYYGEDQYYDGWVDFGDLSFKNYTADDLEHIRLNCFDIYSESDISMLRPCDHLHLKDGKVHWCDMTQAGAQHIPLSSGDYIDLRSDDTVDAQREKIMTFKCGLIECCKYCNVFYQTIEGVGGYAEECEEKATHGNVRVPAATQLTAEERKNLFPVCN